MTKNILVGAGILVTLVLGVLLPFGGTTVVERVSENLGASAGPDMSFRTTFHSGMSQAGVYTIATTSATLTMTDAQMANARVISISEVGTKQPALALTTPASTTWSSLPKSGASQSWIIDDLHTAAATTTTITAGTGVDIDGTTANDDVINGATSGTLTCWRLPNTDVRCHVEEMVDAG